MTKYKIIQNLKTGKDEFSFNAILFEVGENVIKNSNDKDYKIVTLGFQLPSVYVFKLKWTFPKRVFS